MADFGANKYQSRRRYATALAYFFDYLLALDVFSGKYGLGDLKKIISTYPAVLAMGSADMADLLRKELGLEYISRGLTGLSILPHQSASVSNSLAPVNRLIEICAKLEATARAKAEFYNLPVGELYFGSFQMLDEIFISRQEMLSIRQNSVLGNVIRVHPGRLKYSRAKLTYNEKVAVPQEAKEFPRSYFLKLVSSATCWRDKVLWLLLGVLGIRVSEALNITLSHIDFERQEVFVIDPTGNRLAVGDDEKYERFKGRNTCYTFPLPGLRGVLFHAIENYLANEFVPNPAGGDTHLLQYVDYTRRGKSYITVSYENLSKRFKAAAARGAVPFNKLAPSHKEHSLRHMYGGYCSNDWPVNPANGEFGLSDPEVQMMMGHALMATTRKYARPRVEKLRKKLAAQDDEIFGTTSQWLQ